MLVEGCQLSSYIWTKDWIKKTPIPPIRVLNCIGVGFKLCKVIYFYPSFEHRVTLWRDWPSMKPFLFCKFFFTRFCLYLLTKVLNCIEIPKSISENLLKSKVIRKIRNSNNEMDQMTKDDEEVNSFTPYSTRICHYLCELIIWPS